MNVVASKTLGLGRGAYMKVAYLCLNSIKLLFDYTVRITPSSTVHQLMPIVYPPFFVSDASFPPPPHPHQAGGKTNKQTNKRTKNKNKKHRKRATAVYIFTIYIKVWVIFSEKYVNNWGKLFTLLIRDCVIFVLRFGLFHC